MREKCLKSCPISTFIRNRKCIKCHVSCKFCNGINFNRCLKCKNADYILYKGTCLENCPKGMFKRDNNKCQKIPKMNFSSLSNPISFKLTFEFIEKKK